MTLCLTNDRNLCYVITYNVNLADQKTEISFVCCLLRAFEKFGVTCFPAFVRAHPEGLAIRYLPHPEGLAIRYLPHPEGLAIRYLPHPEGLSIRYLPHPVGLGIRYLPHPNLVLDIHHT